MRYIVTLIALIAIFTGNKGFSQVAYSEDFEGAVLPALPVSWTQTKSGSITIPQGWKTHSGAITSTNGWVMPAHTQFAALDDWNNATDTNNPSILITSAFNMSTLVTPYLSFEYYFVGAQYNSGTKPAEKLYVEISTNGGTNWTALGPVLEPNGAEWQKKYIDLSAYIGQANVMLSFKYTDDNAKLIGAGIDNIKVYDPPAKDISVTGVTPAVGSYKEYGIVNSNVNLGGTVFNEGATAITSYTIHYQMGSGAVVSNPVTSVNIAPFTSAVFTASTPLTLPSTNGANDIKVWAELTGDANVTNDSGATQITSVPFMPAKKILAEEGTGTWCGWCPRGHVFMDSINKVHKESFSLVAVHNGDPMTVAAYDTKIGALIGGYPSMIIDRRQEVDPSELFNVYDEHKDNFGFADIALADVVAAGFNYALKVTVKPAIDLSGDYRLALVLVEDDVTGTTSTWAQENYYSSAVGNIPLVGAGLNWQAEPGKVPAAKMFYDHVARAILPNPDGAAGSLPATMTAGATYDYTFNAIMQPFWHRYNNNMHAVVMLIRNSDGHVLNSNNLVVPLGLSDIDAGIDAFKVFPNPASDAAYVNFSLADGADVNIIITDAVGRVINTISRKEMESGNHKIDVDLSTMATGIYNVTLQTEKGSLSTRLAVIK